MLVGCGRQGPGLKSSGGSFTHIYTLDQVRVKFLFCIYKKKKKKIPNWSLNPT